MPHSEAAHVQQIATTLNARFGEPPHVAVVLGSGLGGVTSALEEPVAASYSELGLPASGVVGHDGRLVVGHAGKVRVAALSGRVHLYEGHPPAVVVRGVRALHSWGVRELYLTNSSGGIREGLGPGSLVLITDHLNFQGSNPLTGPPFGTRFPDLTTAYHPVLRQRLRASADALGIPLHEGVYAAMLGPSYETPAEIRMLGRMGADVVGMSTVPEVIAAAELGLPTAAVSVVSNLAAGLSPGPLHHGEVTEAARDAGASLAKILLGAFSAGAP